MSDAVDALVLDLVECVAKRERTYAEVMDAWRTSCPRLQVWEDANDKGFLIRDHADGRAVVRVTPLGLASIAGRHETQHGPTPQYATSR